MPILGTIASQVPANLPTNSFESIATVYLANDSSAITFSSIPQTYMHLQFRVFARDNRGATANNVRWQFNGDTGNNYTSHAIYGDGSSAAAYKDGPTYGVITSIVSNNTDANMFGAFIMDIFDYTNTNKYKTTRTLSGYDINGAGGGLEFDSGLWYSTSAINQISIRLNAASALKAYSHIALYGIKG